MRAFKQFRYDKTMRAWFVARYEVKDGVTYFVGLQHPTEKDWADREAALTAPLEEA